MEPNTGGVLRTSIQDMQVGDYFKMVASVGAGDIYFYDPASYPEVVNEFPFTGKDSTTAHMKYVFYLVKADSGLLIADRVIANNISWDSLNQKEFIQGKGIVSAMTGAGVWMAWNGKMTIRSLGGGNSYADANGNSSKTNAGLGTWPVDNEWNKYVAGMFDGRDDVWHWSGIRTWVQDTAKSSMASSGSLDGSWRVWRGEDVNKAGWMTSSTSAVSTGFRPVFEYQEVTP